jgi:hypothetical protein
MASRLRTYLDLCHSVCRSAPARGVRDQKPTAANKQANRDKHQFPSPVEDVDCEGVTRLVSEGINVGGHNDGKRIIPQDNSGRVSCPRTIADLPSAPIRSLATAKAPH